MMLWWKLRCNIQMRSMKLFSFANNINTIEGGTHYVGVPVGTNANGERICQD